MEIITESEALKILNDNNKESTEREGAVRFLAAHPNDGVIERLVQALEDDDFGVRWEAALALSSIGKTALPSLLQALMDPKRIGDPRLRIGAIRVLHRLTDASLPRSTSKLVEALHGPAADIASMEAAYKVFQELEAGSK
jgi:HEAT repeat protein